MRAEDKDGADTGYVVGPSGVGTVKVPVAPSSASDITH